MAGQIMLRSSTEELDRYFRERDVRTLLLVCGRSAEGIPLGRYFSGLEARTGIRVVRFSDFHPNPLYEEAVKAVEAFCRNRCDAVAAVGGGSAMDVAKCVKLWAELEPAESYLTQPYASNHISLLAAPTTAGTGSEATHFAVIYQGEEKLSVAHESCLPTAVVLDPRALETLPDYHRKSSMLDALCHGVESFWARRAGTESRAFSLEAIRDLRRYMEGYLQNTPAGNVGMLTAAHLAGKAINLTQTTAAHAMSYQLTKRYGIAHGHAAALCLGKLWTYMAERSNGTELEGVLQNLAVVMDCGTVREAGAWLEGLPEALGLKTPEAAEEDYGLLCRSVNQQRLRNNPVPLDAGAIEELYHQILGKRR